MSSNNLGTAVVTGASTGLGAIYADRLAKRGYNLILVARDADRMEALADAPARRDRRDDRSRPRRSHRPKPMSRRSSRSLANDASITLLVNNAGMSLNGGILENGPTELTRIIALNITTPTRLASAAGKAFVARGNGAIINIASVLALAPEMFDGVYSGTKAFILNLSQSMAAQQKDKGLYVQAVLPGATRTEIWERSGKDVDAFPVDMVMSADDLVDAAMVGFDRRETVTIPPLADEGQFTAMQAARLAMAPNLSKRDVAARYREAVTA